MGGNLDSSASAHGGLGLNAAVLTIQPEEGIAAFEPNAVYPQLKQVIVSTGNCIE